MKIKKYKAIIDRGKCIKCRGTGKNWVTENPHEGTERVDEEYPTCSKCAGNGKDTEMVIIEFIKPLNNSRQKGNK